MACHRRCGDSSDFIIVPFLIPINKFKPTIESKASDALGRKVQLGI